MRRKWLLSFAGYAANQETSHPTVHHMS